MKRLIERLRDAFRKQWTWKMFLCLQASGLVALIYKDLTTRSWSFIPRIFDNLGRINIEWDIFDSLFWTHRNYNWVFLVVTFGPFLVAKAVDWVIAARDQDEGGQKTE